VQWKDSLPKRDFSTRALTVQTTDAIIAQNLSDELERYAKDPTNPVRDDHLAQLCQKAKRIRRKTRRHPSSWAFGSWDDDAVQFPSVMADGMMLMNAELE